MNFWEQVSSFFYHLFHRRHPKISLIIPFSSKNLLRKRTFKWLLEYWKHELPNAEIVIGHSKSRVFNKGRALNQAVRKSSGEILVIIDADAYMSGKVIERCAERILEELHNHLWYVPYRHLYRLNSDITRLIVQSDPRHPLRLSSPPSDCFLDDNGHKSSYGHRYMAMCAIIPRQAYEMLGCFDERFSGWGGEDVCFLRAMDTLWGKHKSTDNDVLHLWHEMIGGNYQTRQWVGQTGGGANNELANAYNRATGKPEEMRALVDEGCRKRRK